MNLLDFFYPDKLSFYLENEILFAIQNENNTTISGFGPVVFKMNKTSHYMVVSICTSVYNYTPDKHIPKYWYTLVDFLIEPFDKKKVLVEIDKCVQELKSFHKCDSCEEWNKDLHKSPDKNQNRWICEPCSFGLALKVPIDVCPICLEDLQQFACFATQCKHLFHYKCLKKIEKNVCPLCRDDLSWDNELCRYIFENRFQ